MKHKNKTYFSYFKSFINSETTKTVYWGCVTLVFIHFETRCFISVKFKWRSVLFSSGYDWYINMMISVAREYNALKAIRFFSRSVFFIICSVLMPFHSVLALADNYISKDERKVLQGRVVHTAVSYKFL